MDLLLPVTKAHRSYPRRIILRFVVSKKIKFRHLQVHILKLKIREYSWAKSELNLAHNLELNLGRSIGAQPSCGRNRKQQRVFVGARRLQMFKIGE